MSMAVNYWAVLIAAITSMIIGSIWYGPLFGKKFMQAMGMDKWTSEEQEKAKKGMVKAYVGQFIGSFVMFVVLAGYIVTSVGIGIHSGLVHAFVLWLGFVVPLALGNALWGGGMTLFWLNTGNMLVTLLVAGAIIGGWR